MRMLSEPPIIALAKRVLDPAICGLTFIVFVNVFQSPWTSYQTILFTAIMLLSWVISRILRPLIDFRHYSGRAYILAILVGSAIFILLIYSLFLRTQFSEHVETGVVTAWLVSVPVFLLAAHGGFHYWLRNKYKKSSSLRKCVIVGATELACQLSREVGTDPSLMIRFEGFFDSRSKERICEDCREQLLGGIDDAADYVKNHSIQLVFIALPIKSEAGVARLLQKLHDTTASVYFVPDMTNLDLIQSRVDSIHNIPVVSILESPVYHLNAIWKSIFDFVMSLIILSIIAPLLCLIALTIKLSSPGPVLFKQARYGLDGKKIMVYKFRSMNVCENGSVIKQASKGDARIYPFGAFLRKTSLDELPQFFNVLKGDMSIVGPRPHAVAHNEEYRKLIQGYMLRHKVKPGITGWAQVNGLRGETETVEKMEKRVHYDLEYLRNWSMLLDIIIIFKTFGVVLKATNAH